MKLRIRSLVVGLALSIGSIVFSLCLAEGFFYYADPAASLPQNGLVGGKRFTWGHPVRQNSFGARGPEPVIPKPEGEYRVLSLGDSLTWGAGVSEDERYTNVTELLLRKENDSVRIVNLAHSGNPLIAYRDQLYQSGEAIDPNLITVGFCFNDPQPRPQDYSPERKAYMRRNKDTLIFLFRSRQYLPFLAQRLQKGFEAWGERTGKFPSWFEALDRVYEKESPEWKAFEVALGDIVRWSEGRHLPQPIFMALNQGSSTVHPTYYSAPDEKLELFLGWWDQAMDAARQHGFLVFDFRNEFKERLDGEVLGVNQLDGHPSREEHRIYGEKLARVIRDKYLLASGTVDSDATNSE